MRPILLLQNQANDGPAFLLDWLRSQSVEVDLRMTSHDEIPTNMSRYSALAVLGGAMSVNDPLPFIGKTVNLIRDAMSSGKPVIGHCLGGQLMAKALGATVSGSPHAEVGWHGIDIVDSYAAAEWFGDLRKTRRGGTATAVTLVLLEGDNEVRVTLGNAAARILR